MIFSFLTLVNLSLSGNTTGIAVGAALGALALIAIIVIVAILYRRNKSGRYTREQ